MLMYGITLATHLGQSKSFNRRTGSSTGIVLQLNATRQRLRAQYNSSSTHERIQRPHARSYKTSLRQQQHTKYRDDVSCGEPSRLSCKHVQEESSRLRENTNQKHDTCHQLETAREGGLSQVGVVQQ